MSHITDVRTKIRDKQCLVEALIAVGFKREEIEVHDKAVSFSTEYSSGTLGHGEVIIRKAAQKAHGGEGWNDIGFHKAETGEYLASIDTMGKFSSKGWLDSVTQQYGIEKAKKEGLAEGHVLLEQSKQKNGDVVLIFQGA